MTARIGMIGVVAAFLAACGGGGGSTASTMTAACDWTAVVDTTASQYRKCEQVTGPRSEIEPELGACASGSDTVPAGVVRTTCPSTGGAGLVGCCSYPWSGMDMTWCYYDPVRHAGVEPGCHGTVNGEPMLWTTTVPLP